VSLGSLASYPRKLFFTAHMSCWGVTQGIMCISGGMYIEHDVDVVERSRSSCTPDCIEWNFANDHRKKYYQRKSVLLKVSMER
jgi:hypothetical protein